MPIKGYENYSVSTFGRMWSARKGLLKTPLNNTGYPHMNLCKNAKCKRTLVHRLMAEAFLPNPENKPTVNHKNGVRYDNRIENIEWATSAEQNIHSVVVLGRKGAINSHRQKNIVAYREGLLAVLEFGGIREASRFLNIPYQGIQNVLKRRKGNHTYKGWKFELLYDPKWIAKTGLVY